MDEEDVGIGCDISLSARLIAACGGSVFTSLVSNPFDVVRVRMQQQSAIESSHSQKPPPPPVAPLPSQSPMRLNKLHAQKLLLEPQALGVSVCCRDVFWYPSTLEYCVATAEPLNCAVKPAMSTTIPHTGWQTALSIFNNEGPTTLWRGVSIQLLQAIPANVVYFIAYESLRDSLEKYTGSFTPLLGGGIARALSSTIVSPLELVKTRLQSVSSTSAESPSQIVWRSVRGMLKSDGPRALWSGLSLTLWRDVPFSSIYWLIVEHVRSVWGPVASNRDTFLQSFSSGCIGGMVAATVTTPFDVGKTRRQLGSSTCQSAQMSIPRFMAHIWREEGLGALFVGLGPRVLKVAPACGIMISSYEMGKRFLT